MIIAIKDIDGSKRIVKEVTAALAGYATHLGFDTLVLQFDTEEDHAIDSLLFHEAKSSDAGDGYYAETGIDMLLSEATMNNIPRDSFYDAVRPFAQGRRLDVAEVSKQSNFYAKLVESEKEVMTLLASANAAYDLVFVPLTAGDEKSLFGHYADSVKEQFGNVIWTVRQGSVGDLTHEHYANETYVVTGYHPESKFTCRTMGKRVAAGKFPVLPLETPCALRDAVDEGRLAVFLRKAKANEDDPCSDTCVWSRQVADILSTVGKTRRNGAADVWNTVEFE